MAGWLAGSGWSFPWGASALTLCRICDCSGGLGRQVSQSFHPSIHPSVPSTAPRGHVVLFVLVCHGVALCLRKAARRPSRCVSTVQTLSTRTCFQRVKQSRSRGHGGGRMNAERRVWGASIHMLSCPVLGRGLWFWLWFWPAPHQEKGPQPPPTPEDCRSEAFDIVPGWCVRRGRTRQVSEEPSASTAIPGPHPPSGMTEDDAGAGAGGRRRRPQWGRAIAETANAETYIWWRHGQMGLSSPETRRTPRDKCDCAKKAWNAHTAHCAGNGLHRNLALPLHATPPYCAVMELRRARLVACKVTRRRRRRARSGEDSLRVPHCTRRVGILPAWHWQPCLPHLASKARHGFSSRNAKVICD